MRQKEIVAGALAQILFAIFMFIVIISDLLPFSGFMNYLRLGFLSYFIYFYAAWLLLPSAIKISDDFRSHPAGVMAGIFGIFSAITGMFFYAGGPYAISYAPGFTYRYYSEYVFFPTMFGWLLIFIADIFLGSMSVMLGWFFLKEEIRFSPRLLWFATGVIYVVAGALGLALIVTFAAYPLMIVANIMGAISFLVSKPSDYVEKKIRRITNIKT